MSIIEYPYEDGIKIKVGDTTVFTITRFGFFGKESPSSTSPGAPFDIEVIEAWIENEGQEPFRLSSTATGTFGNLYENEIQREVLLHREAMNASWALERKLSDRESKNCHSRGGV